MTSPALPPEFWDRSRALDHVRRAAVSRCRTPSGLLGTVLARISAQTDTEHSALPPLFVGLVGGSGSGKSSTLSLGSALVPMPPGVAEFAGASAAALWRGRKNYPGGLMLSVDDGAVLARQAENEKPLARALAATWWAERPMNLGIGFGLASAFMPHQAQAVLNSQLGPMFVCFGMTDPSLPKKLPEYPGPIAVVPPSERAARRMGTAPVNATDRVHFTLCGLLARLDGHRWTRRSQIEDMADAVLEVSEQVKAQTLGVQVPA